jgi:signal transduction histidine kinase
MHGVPEGKISFHSSMRTAMPSFFTTLLDSTLHFGTAIEQLTLQLLNTAVADIDQLELQVKLAYCYAHTNLPKGVEIAEDTIAKAGISDNRRIVGYALCSKALNLYWIGYTARARAAAEQALLIFESLHDLSGQAEACYQIGTMVNISVGPADTPVYLERALQLFTDLGDTTGCRLVDIQQTLLLLFVGRFDDAFMHYETLLLELTAPADEHLRCKIYSHLAEGMFMKPNLHACKLYSEQWLKTAEATGNFHDYTRTSSLLPELRRHEGMDKHILESCIEAIRCCEELGSYYGYATSAIVMANICMDQLQYDDAIYHYRKGGEAAAEIQYSFLCHMALLGVGNAELGKGNVAEARSVFLTVLQKAKETHDRLNQIAAQRHLAEVALGQNEFDEAFAAYHSLFKAADGYGLYPRDYGHYARIIAKASERALASAGMQAGNRRSLQLEHIETHLKLAKEQAQKPEEANAYYSLSEFYEESGELIKALDFRKLYIELHEQITNEENNKAISKLRLNYETEMKDREIALLKKENMEALLSERLRISRDLHDDIGATLSSISVYSTAAKQRLAESRIAEAEAILDTMSQDAREMVSTMSDMVWMMNPSSELPGKLLDRMKQVASHALLLNDIPVRFSANEGFDGLNLPMDARKNIFLIFKEAVNNIAKYADATVVFIELNYKEGTLSINISDNGRGFNTGIDYAGNGLHNMRARIAALHGKLSIVSESGKGTSLSFSCPCHPHK